MSAYRHWGEAGRITVPPFPAVAGSKLVIALPGTSEHENRHKGGRSTVQIAAPNPRIFMDVLASAIRISAL